MMSFNFVPVAAMVKIDFSDPSEVDFKSSDFKDDEDAIRVFNTPVRDPYKILNLSVGDTPDLPTLARKVYRGLSKKFHPDKLVEKNEITQKVGIFLFKKISAANARISEGTPITKENVNENVNEEGDDLTPLNRALISHQDDIALSLLDRGADPNIKCKVLFDVHSKIICNSLFLALMHKSGLDVINKLLEKGVNTYDTAVREARWGEVLLTLSDFLSQTTTDIFNAIKVFELKKINEAISSGTASSTDLFKSVELGLFDVAKKLLDKGANVNEVDSTGRTPLCYAVQNKDEKIVRLLLSFKANPNYTYPSFNYSDARISKYKLIHKAVELGDVSIIKLLLKFGANPNSGFDIDRTDFSPIFNKRSYSCPYISNLNQLPILHDTTYYHGLPPIFLAKITDKPVEVFKLLVVFGANIYQTIEFSGELAGQEGIYKYLINIRGGSSDAAYFILEQQYESIVMKFLTRSGYSVKSLLSRNYAYRARYIAAIRRNWDRFTRWVFMQRTKNKS